MRTMFVVWALGTVLLSAACSGKADEATAACRESHRQASGPLDEANRCDTCCRVKLDTAEIGHGRVNKTPGTFGECVCSE